MTPIDRIEHYLRAFFSERFDSLDFFYRTTHQQRTWGIYKLKHGTKLMDFVISIHARVEDHLHFDHLIPHKFVTPERLFKFLNDFKSFLNSKQYMLDDNFEGEDTDMIITYIQEFKDDLVDMVDYVKKLYDQEEAIIPYQELRYQLITKNINGFVTTLKSIMASVSYAIVKVKEGYFHSNVHVVLKLLGFEIISEEMTNIGRIDAVIRLSDLIYILEFKFGDNEDLSQQALNQVKLKKYAQKFLIERKEIIGVGISFDEKQRNINGLVYERIDK
ncbi:PD-(D/E)XK nuclease domain-containing protein [Mucilaginibacter rubeus]|uniref:PD-(D/E)XK nuclease domain-containing protein n=1 Tax=Mucilaginibacter rubeus TaxID=2027860 RepID=UPI001667DD31|nr:PD-(D/E)XK nuclease domain-containing protein [Mucilaginibacter rubeus]GGA95950.1 hypothetical protein GCM10011500_09650 [Mucilaginibacter rubeus]